MVRRQALAFVAAVGIALTLAPSATRAAEGQQQLVGRWAFDHLNRAQEALANNQWAEATAAMDEMSRKLALNDYERALMWQTYGYIASGQDKYLKAAEAFQKALAFNALPEGAQLNTQFNVGQMYFAAENYKKAAATFEDWLTKAQNPSPTAFYMLAMSYVQQKKFKQALVYAKRMIAGSDKPREAWLLTINSIYYELKQTREMVDVLKQLIDLYPKKAYWIQLSAVYNDLKMEKEALAVMELAYAQGYLTDQNSLVNLAQLYLYHSIPMKAAKVLEKGMANGTIKRDAKNLTLLGNALLNADEYDRALAPMIEAAGLGKDGDLYVRIAQVYFDDEKWEKATDMVQKALAQPSLTDPGNAWVLLGISYFQPKQYAKARKAFLKARDFEKSRKTADKWLDVVAKATAPKQQQ